jgi:hypothetical protein
MLMNTGSIIRYEGCEPENLAAAFDLDLAVADRPRDPAGRLDQEDFTGQQAVLDGDGRSFDDVAAQQSGSESAGAA